MESVKFEATLPLLMVYRTVRGIMDCNVDLDSKMIALKSYVFIIYLEGDKHKMRTLLVATKAFKKNSIVKDTIQLIVTKLEQITGKPLV
jgi:hypothetical protein